MASRRDEQVVHPVPYSDNTNAVYNHKRDEESLESSEELRRKKRIKYLAYFAAFVIFQTAIIVLFSLTVMKIRTPKFRVRTATLETFHVGTAANSSFDLRMDAGFGVKNANFGKYKFQNSTIYFFYAGTPVGQAIVPSGKAGWLSTKKLNLEVDLSSSGLSGNVVSQLGNDISSGVLNFSVQSQLNGKVELMFMFKKKKSTNMDCTIAIGLADKAVRGITCK